MSVIVLGTDGFIGRHLHAGIKLPPGAELVAVRGRRDLDLLDADAVKAFFASHGNVTHVFYCAAVGGLRSQQDQASDYDVNVSMFFNVLNAMPPRALLVHYTSGAALDRSRSINSLTELPEVPPPDPYGAAKHRIETDTKGDPRVLHVRVFGCHSSDESEFRFIATCARAAAAEVPVFIERNRLFSYCTAADLVTQANSNIIPYGCKGGRTVDAPNGTASLSQWAESVGAQPIITSPEAWGLNYCGRNTIVPQAVVSVRDTTNVLIFGASGSIGSAVLAAVTDAVPKLRLVTVGHEDANSKDWPPHDLPGFDIVVWAGGDNVNDAATGDWDEGDFQRVMDANCTFVMRTAQKLWKGGHVAYAARLCVVSSIWQVQTRQGKMSYTVSKAAVGGVVRSLAAEMGTRQVLVNALLPGPVDNEMTRATMPLEAQAEVKRRTGFRRMVTAREVAKAVLALTVQHTGITGQSVPVDLGFTVNSGL